MNRQITFPESENIQLDKEIKKTMQREFPLPEKVEDAQKAAFAQIREMQAEKGTQESEKKQAYANAAAAKTRKKNKRGAFFKSCAGLAAAAAAFSGVCIVNPAFAAQIPLVGHVFEELGESLGFSGDFSKYAKTLEEPGSVDAAGTGENGTGGAGESGANGGNSTGSTGESGTDGDRMDGTSGTAVSTGDNGKMLYTQTHDGMTVTLSEVYCNDVALYVSMIIRSEDKFPETMTWNDNTPMIRLLRSTMKFSYNSENQNLFGVEDCLDGKMIDEYTYAGVLRFDLSYTVDTSDADGFNEAYYEFLEDLGVTEEEIDNSPEEAAEKIRNLLGIDEINDKTIAEAGGPDWKDYESSVEIPDSFTVDFTIPQIIGNKPEAQLPEMPEDIRAEYEQAMKDNGLGLTDEDYAGFTEEQKEIEHQLFTKMWNAYDERYPEALEQPNQYENWWVDGPWEFTFDVTRDNSQTIVKEINDVDENGLGLVSVTKTPFEVTIQDGQGIDYFTVVLDADGNIMENGKFGGATNTLAVSDYDISKIDIYICGYDEYMDELKGYYYSDDYEEKKKEKTFKQLLDERALYHKEIIFEE